MIHSEPLNFANLTVGLGLLRETRNLVQFLYEYKVTSPTDKMNTNESKSNFLHKIVKYFVCIFFINFNY